MTSRTSRLTWAATGLALALLTGCSGQSNSDTALADGAAEAAAAADLAPSQTVVDDTQTTPTKVVAAFVQRLGAGEYQGACDLMEEAARAIIATEGTSCVTALGSKMTPQMRATFASMQVPEQEVDLSSDFAKVAVTGVDEDGDAIDGGLPASRAYGVWWVAWQW